MVDVDGMLVQCNSCPRSNIFTEADISLLYGKPVTWDQYNELVDN
jgi:hypothetical protein